TGCRAASAEHPHRNHEVARRDGKISGRRARAVPGRCRRAVEHAHARVFLDRDVGVVPAGPGYANGVRPAAGDRVEQRHNLAFAVRLGAKRRPSIARRVGHGERTGDVGIVFNAADQQVACGVGTGECDARRGRLIRLDESRAQRAGEQTEDGKQPSHYALHPVPESKNTPEKTFGPMPASWLLRSVHACCRVALMFAAASPMGTVSACTSSRTLPFWMAWFSAALAPAQAELAVTGAAPLVIANQNAA